MYLPGGNWGGGLAAWLWNNCDYESLQGRERSAGALTRCWLCRCVSAADGLLQDLLHPLGLQANRMAAVRSVSHNFLATDWHTPAEFQ